MSETTAEEFVAHLIRDDISRVSDGVELERDGRKAIEGWRRSAARAGDVAIIKVLDQYDADVLAKLWDELVDSIS